MNAIFDSVEGTIGYRDLVQLIKGAPLKESRRRDMLSAINRVLKMANVFHRNFMFSASSTRELLNSIKPTAQGISKRTFANLRSDLGAALALAGITSPKRHGLFDIDHMWSPLLDLSERNMPLNGLRRFVRFCSSRNINPEQVVDATVQHFQAWLASSTLVPDPVGTARAIPRLWRLAQSELKDWPGSLSKVETHRAPRKLIWKEFADAFRQDTDSYLEMRRNPDIFDERPETPKRPLRESTIRLQREHIRLSYNILMEAGLPAQSLADLVEPESFKAILRHYSKRSEGKACSFTTGVAKTLIAIARVHVHVDTQHIARLKALAARLPAIPIDMTAKNKRLIAEMLTDRNIEKLVLLPRLMVAEAGTLLKNAKQLSIVANVALALALLLEAPMRSQNLVTLNARKHLREPKGARGFLQILVDASETKAGRSDLVFELSPSTSELVRWYRKVVLPALGADPDGDLFVMSGGRRRGQGDLSNRIKVAINEHLGIAMTVHQFRHLAAARYLQERPHDFETIRQLLGHAFAKTTAVYAGLNGERASRAFGEIVLAQSAELEKRACQKRHRTHRHRK